MLLVERINSNSTSTSTGTSTTNNNNKDKDTSTSTATGTSSLVERNQLPGTLPSNLQQNNYSHGQEPPSLSRRGSTFNSRVNSTSSFTPNSNNSTSNNDDTIITTAAISGSLDTEKKLRFNLQGLFKKLPVLGTTSANTSTITVNSSSPPPPPPTQQQPQQPQQPQQQPQQQTTSSSSSSSSLPLSFQPPHTRNNTINDTTSFTPITTLTFTQTPPSFIRHNSFPRQVPRSTNIISDINPITIIHSVDEEDESLIHDIDEEDEEDCSLAEDHNQQQQQQQQQSHLLSSIDPYSFTPNNNLQPIDKANLFSGQPSYFSSHYTTMVNNQEVYTSFTSDCISLQNSEMSTAITELDSDTMIINNSNNDNMNSYNKQINNIGNGSISSQEAPIKERKLSNTSSLSLSFPSIKRTISLKSKKLQLLRQQQQQQQQQLLLLNNDELLIPTSTLPKANSAKTTASVTTARPNAPKRNLKSLLRIGSFSGNNNIQSTNPHKENPALAPAPTPSTITATTPTASTAAVVEGLPEDEDIFAQPDDYEDLSETESELNYDPKQEESSLDYRVGGYHPVCRGDIYYSKQLANREYVIVRKLGWGHFSTVWLAKSRITSSVDSTLNESNDNSGSIDKNEYYVAIKFVKSNRNYKEAAKDEIEILHTLSDPLKYATHLSFKQLQYFQTCKPKQHQGYKHMMRLLDDFEIAGPHGNHICMVFEILGENVLNLIYKYKKFYRNVNQELKKKQESVGEEQTQLSPTLQLQLQSQQQQQQQQSSTPIQVPTLPQQNIKFNKWDAKYLTKKKNTKSKLSLGLTKKAESLESNNTSTPPYPLSSSSAASSTTSSNNSGSGSGSGSAAGDHLMESLVELESTTTIGSWEDSIDKRIKQMKPSSLVKIIETSKSRGGIPLHLVKKIVKQMLLALDYMHHCGVIHTDLKPENILIDIEDINKVVKSLEEEKQQKIRANSMSRTASLMKRNNSHVTRPSILKRNSTSATIQQQQHHQLQQQQQQQQPQQQQPQQQKHRRASSSASSSLISSSQTSNNGFYYRRLKNSIAGKYDSPIRCSKPLLSSSVSQEVFFKDVDFDKCKKASVSRSIISPRFTSLLWDSKKEDKNNTNTGNDHSIDNELNIKIADLGNATYTNQHFTNQIQTRQYRSPEIILKYKSWGSSTDIWSLGCIIFELITGDFLFDPHEGDGKNMFDKDEDHLAQIVELLGHFPDDEYLVDCKLTGKFFKLAPGYESTSPTNSAESFNSASQSKVIFKNIDNLKIWKLQDVLIEKYKFDRDDPDVKLVCDLILKCLKFNLDERFDAHSLLKHPWFNEKAGADSNAAAVDETVLQSMKNEHDDLPGYTCEE